MDKITVLFPGGFKPLTGAHLALAQRYAESPEVERVIMLIGPKDRNGITREKTQEIFQLVNDNNSKITMQPTQHNSPIVAAYEYLFDLPENTTGRYAMAASTKGDDYVRAKAFIPNVDKYITIGDKNGRRMPQGIDATELSVDVEPITDANGYPISATDVRNALAQNDYNTFRQAYPNHDDAIVKNIWQILRGQQEAALFTQDWWSSILQEDITAVVETYNIKHPAKKSKLIKEGGAAGHMAHIWDDHGLTFADMKELVARALAGRLDIEEAVTEKTDGQNIQVTWKNGQPGFARNKGTVINPLTPDQLIADFERKYQDSVAKNGEEAAAGYRNVVEAYRACAEDLTEAMSQIDQARLQQIFKDGRVFANMEIIYPATQNVIAYDKAHLQFHNLVEYDETGQKVQTDMTGGKLMQQIIADANAHMQKTFSFIPPQRIKLGRVADFEDQKAAFFSEIDQLQNQFGLSDTDRISEYHKAWWRDVITSKAQQMAYEIPENVLTSLIYRWAFFDKSTSIAALKKQIENPEFANWVTEFDKNEFKQYYKQNMEPFESIFLRLGAVVLRNATNFLAANPDRTIQSIKNDLAALIKDLQTSPNPQVIAKLKTELKRIEQLGGFDAIVPAEGLVFVFRGNTYKLTGAFAPINQILGTLKYMR